MRPLTIILLIVIVGIVGFFGYSIWKNKSANPASQPSVAKTDVVKTEKQFFKLKVNSKSVYVNDKEIILDSPVLEIDGRTMVPIKFLLDFLKAENLQYDKKTEEITFELNIPANKGTTLGTETTMPSADTLLTEKIKNDIKRVAGISSTYYTIDTMESDGKNIFIWLNLAMEPKDFTDVQKWTDSLANEVSNIFESKNDVSVIATRKEPGSETKKTFGTSKFSASSGKIEFSQKK